MMNFFNTLKMKELIQGATAENKTFECFELKSGLDSTLEFDVCEIIGESENFKIRLSLQSHKYVKVSNVSIYVQDVNGIEIEVADQWGMKFWIKKFPHRKEVVQFLTQAQKEMKIFLKETQKEHAALIKLEKEQQKEKLQSLSLKH